jgi:hypothetical protein
MAGTPGKTGPAFLAAAAANITNPAANTYILIKHIHLENKNAAARVVNLFVGLTGGSLAGTGILEGHSIAPAGSTTADDFFDLYFPQGLRLAAADFLTGFCTADATSVTVTVTWEAFAV